MKVLNLSYSPSILDETYYYLKLLYLYPKKNTDGNL